eukprot:TRINITY_DN2806_c0_g1_i5.p1 TRINITY_DN2806_c0_g1~~TRINITY_DN2806_c0_g1_i5.p1  ORF type:complete len:348 (+),score=126.86 TRINITY_DN2806_c0_g1_i5:126-1169(+)
MKTLSRFLLLGSWSSWLWLGTALRQADDESEALLGPKGEIDLTLAPGELAQALVDKFGNAQEYAASRPALAKIRETEMNGGAKGNTRKYEYLGTQCMGKRVFWSAEQFKAAGCKRILEVGGYHQPLPKIATNKELPDGLELYVDVDPSAEETKLETWNDKFASATLKILLDEFRSKTTDDILKTVHLGSAFDCFLMLGTSTQNVGDDNSKKAFKEAVSEAKQVIIEYPSSNKDTLDHVEPVMKDAGLEKGEEKQVDCSDNADSILKMSEGCGQDNSCLTRNMIVYNRPSKGNDEGSGAAESTDDSKPSEEKEEEKKEEDDKEDSSAEKKEEEELTKRTKQKSQKEPP